MLALIYILAIAITFLSISAAVKIVCMCFGVAFLWRYVFGVWAILYLLKSFIGGRE